MENASKALIIAGAILISILIISLGVIIYQQAAGVVNNNSMDELEVTQFNSKFENYFGNNIKGATAQSLVEAVKANNNSQDDTSRMVEVTVVADNFSNEAKGEVASKPTSYPTLAKGKTYQIKAVRYTTAGLISKIEIKANK